MKEGLFYFFYDRKKGMEVEKKHEKEKRPESRELATVYMMGPTYCPAILFCFNLLLNSSYPSNIKSYRIKKDRVKERDRKKETETERRLNKERKRERGRSVL